MRIAVTYDDGLVFQHFGHTEAFKVYTVEDGKVIDSQVVSSDGQGHGALAGLLSDKAIDALVCGGIGMGPSTPSPTTGSGCTPECRAMPTRPSRDFLQGLWNTVRVRTAVITMSMGKGTGAITMTMAIPVPAIIELPSPKALS